MITETAQVVPSGLSFRRLALIGRRQWWVVVGCVVLAALGSVAYSRTRTVTYTASAVVEVASPYTSPGTSAAGTGVTGPLLTGQLDPLQEIEAPSVVAAAAKAGGVSPGAVDLGAVVDDDDVSISSTASSAASAVSMANAAARAFVKQRVVDVGKAVASLDPQLTTLSGEIAKLQGAIKSKSKSPAVAAAKTELTVVQGQYQTLYAQQQQISLAASSISIGTKASLSDVAGSGSGHKVVEVALVAGLLAGCGIALAREQFDDKIRSAAELAEVTTGGVLAELPVSDLGRGKATIADAPSGSMAEAVRELRTAMRFLSVKRPIRTVLVTSAGSREGKSFVAANLAAAWAMSGVRTILVSSDLRRPTLERRFEVTGTSRGLSDAIVDAALLGHGRDIHGFDLGRRPVASGGEEGTEGSGGDPDRLDGDVDVDDLLMETGVKGLSLLPSGSLPPNPAELLGSPELGKLLVSLRERAEVVVLDSPPVLAVTDALVLTAQVDGVVFVTSVNRTSRSAAQRALRQLESGLAPLLGVVVNRSRRSQVTRY